MSKPTFSYMIETPTGALTPTTASRVAATAWKRFIDPGRCLEDERVRTFQGLLEDKGFSVVRVEIKKVQP